MMESELYDIRSLRTAVAVYDAELYFIALLKCLKAIHLDCRIVNEYVVLAVLQS